jgi:hypothetical protein
MKFFYHGPRLVLISDIETLDVGLPFHGLPIQTKIRGV